MAAAGGSGKARGPQAGAGLPRRAVEIVREGGVLALVEEVALVVGLAAVLALALAVLALGLAGVAGGAGCFLFPSPRPRERTKARMPASCWQKKT